MKWRRTGRFQGARDATDRTRAATLTVADAEQECGPPSFEMSSAALLGPSGSLNTSVIDKPALTDKWRNKVPVEMIKLDVKKFIMQRISINYAVSEG